MPTCQRCGKEFKVKRKSLETKARFCSRRCHFESRKLYRTCQACGKKFHVQLSRVDHGHDLYCSPDCRSEGLKKRILVTCDGCKKQFSRQPHLVNHHNFCSRDCHQKFLRKDGWRCEVCGITLVEATNRHKGNKLAYRQKRTSGKLRTCSRACGMKISKHVTRKQVACYTCFKLVWRTKSTIKRYNFCSRRCMYVWREGERREAQRLSADGAENSYLQV